MSYLSFDATQVEPAAPMEVIPAGQYLAAVKDSVVNPTKSGTGQVLTLTWQILDGPFANRLVFDRLNVVNANPQAEQIGQRQLSSLCHAVNVLRMQDTSELHGIPCVIRVTIRKDESGKYGDSNEVKSYSTPAGQVAQAAPQAFHAATAAQASPMPPPQSRPAPAAPAAPWAMNR